MLDRDTAPGRQLLGEWPLAGIPAPQLRGMARARDEAAEEALTAGLHQEARRHWQVAAQLREMARAAG